MNAKDQDTSGCGEAIFRDGNRKDQEEQGQYQPYPDTENDETEEKFEKSDHS